MKYKHYIHFYNGGTTKPNFALLESNDSIPKDTDIIDSIRACIKHNEGVLDRPAIVSISTVLNK